MIVAGFILAAAMLREINLMMLLFGVMVGVMAISYRLARNTLRGLEFKRHLPDSVCAGDLLIVEFEARNTRRRLPSWAVVVSDTFTRQSASRRPRRVAAQAMFTHLPAGQTRSSGYRGRLTERGRYRVGPLRVSTRFPFGLLRCTSWIDQPDTLIVAPRLGRLTHRWDRLRQRVDLGNELTERRQGHSEGEFYGLRDWRPGDSRRWIHWRTSARRGGLAVRQFERQSKQDVAVLLDLWRPAKPTSAQLDTIELAVSFVGTMVADLCRRGGRSLLVAVSGPSPMVSVGATSWAIMREAMHNLSVAEAGHEEHLADLLCAALDAARPGMNILLVTTHPVDLTDTQRLAEVYRDPKRRTLVKRIRIIDAGSDQLHEFYHPE